MTLDKFEEKLKQKFPNEHYTIIYAGKNSAENSIIKCLDCNRKITVNTGELFRSRRKSICCKCNRIREDTLKNREKVKNILKDIGYDFNFFMSKQSINGNYGDKVCFKCKKCSYQNELWVSNVLRNHKTTCQYCSGQKKNKDNNIFLMELNNKYPNKFTLLTPYIDVNKKIKVRCNDCGFIRDVKPTTLMRSGYCPKCGKRVSKAEEVIGNWLSEHNIPYETQKYFKNWNIGIHYFDFYLPEQHILIEFQGVQHYYYNPFFHHNEDNFIYRKEKDRIKKEEALKQGYNYLSISYKVQDFLPEILEKVLDTTTISKESRGKCLEIESSPREEDIVWS